MRVMLPTELTNLIFTAEPVCRNTNADKRQTRNT